MKTKTLFLLIFLFVSSLTFSQLVSNDDRAGRNYYLNYASVTKGKSLNEDFYAGIKGSAYTSDYSPIKINNYQTVQLGRYDAYRDLFEVKNINKKIHLNKFVGFKVINLNNNTIYQVFKYKKRNLFLKIKNKEKNCFLLTKETVKLYGGNKPNSSYDDFINPYFKRLSDANYISIDGENAYIISSSIKKFSKIFTTKKKLIYNYIKSERLDIKNTNDVLKIIKYYNSL